MAFPHDCSQSCGESAVCTSASARIIPFVELTRPSSWLWNQFPRCSLAQPSTPTQYVGLKLGMFSTQHATREAAAKWGQVLQSHIRCFHGYNYQHSSYDLSGFNNECNENSVAMPRKRRRRGRWRASELTRQDGECRITRPDPLSLGGELLHLRQTVLGIIRVLAVVARRE